MIKYEVTLVQNENGIMHNAEQLLTLVNSEQYKKFNYIVTKNNYEAAKTDKKQLSEELEKAKRARIDYEKKMLSEWTPVKEKLMQGEKIIESYIKGLKKGIEDQDEKEKKEREDDIRKYYTEVKGELDIPFEVVINKEYFNKSCSKKKWQEGIKKKMSDITLDYVLLGDMDVEDKVLLQAIFTKTWDRQKALDEYKNQISIRKKSEELKSKKEVEKTISNIPSEKNSSDSLKPIVIGSKPITKTKSIVKEMVSIRGDVDTYKKVKDYAVSLGLVWEEL